MDEWVGAWERARFRVGSLVQLLLIRAMGTGSQCQIQLMPLTGCLLLQLVFLLATNAWSVSVLLHTGI